MADFTYQIKSEVTPTEIKPGQQISMKIELTEVIGEVKYVQMSIPEYGEWISLSPKGEGVYSTTYYVPYEAPYGTYTVKAYAISADGKRGPVDTFTVDVK